MDNPTLVKRVADGRNVYLNIEHVVSIEETIDQLGLWPQTVVTDINNVKYVSTFPIEYWKKSL